MSVTLFFDAFESRRTSYIGPIAGLIPFQVALDELKYQAANVLHTLRDAFQVTARKFFALTRINFRLPEVQNDQEAPAIIEPAAHEAALLFAGEVISTTITYDYDPLYRLTDADYSDCQVSPVSGEIMWLIIGRKLTPKLYFGYIQIF